MVAIIWARLHPNRFIFVARVFVEHFRRCKNQKGGHGKSERLAHRVSDAAKPSGLSKSSRKPTFFRNSLSYNLSMYFWCYAFGSSIPRQEIAHFLYSFFDFTLKYRVFGFFYKAPSRALFSSILPPLSVDKAQKWNVAWIVFYRERVPFPFR